MAIKKAYHHLKYEDRWKIETMLGMKMSKNEIANRLGVHRTTIWREIKRNKKKNSEYHYEHAHKVACARKNASVAIPFKMTDAMVKAITKKLCDEQWSPQQISGFMKVNDMQSVSHETIYKYIWNEKKHGGKLYMHLRHSGKKYNKRNGKNSGRGLIPNRIDIDQRPLIVGTKTRIGDWECDTIIGSEHKGALVSIVDRASKLTKLVLVENKTAETVTRAVTEALAPLRAFVHTITCDNGKEFAMHARITESLNAQVYFAKPYHSWERGLNEHTNGLIRQYFPKKTRFDTITPADVQKIENLLNNRPRKILNYRTPLEVFNAATLQIRCVALQC